MSTETKRESIPPEENPAIVLPQEEKAPQEETVDFIESGWLEQWQALINTSRSLEVTKDNDGCFSLYLLRLAPDGSVRERVRLNTWARYTDGIGELILLTEALQKAVNYNPRVAGTVVKGV